MSPSFRNRIRVMLGPTAVLVSRTPPGMRPQAAATDAGTCAPSPGEPRWKAALTKMQEQLQRADCRKGSCDVILSEYFVRYATLPWHEELLNRREAPAYASARICEIYGQTAERWEVWLDGVSRGAPCLVGAIDRALLLDLRGVCAESGLTLRSVSPFMSTAFDRCRKEIPVRDFWFAASDGFRLSAGRIAAGRWVSVHSEPLDDGVEESLRRALARDLLFGAGPSLAYVCQPGPPRVDWPPIDGVSVVQLAPGDLANVMPFDRLPNPAAP